MAESFGFRGGESYWTLRRRIRAQISEQFDQNLGAQNSGEVFVETPDYEMETVGSFDDLILNESDEEFEVHSSSSEESCISDDIETAEASLAEQLAMWAVKFNVTTTSLGSLLSILKGFHKELPLDPRTLLHTPTKYPINNLVSGGEMCYFGIGSGIKSLAENGSLLHLGPTDTIELQFNVDGLPLFKSSNLQLWPILCLVKIETLKKPFVVAAYCGKKSLLICMNIYQSLLGNLKNSHKMEFM